MAITTKHSIFPSEETQKKIRDIIADIHKGIIGRLAELDDNVFQLACAVASEKDGDHLEIGALHGGSAILIALLKKEMGHKGKVYCIDPLDGYYKNTAHECPVDPVTFLPVSLEILVQNIRIFSMEKQIIILITKSIPWPNKLKDKIFTTAFIDGDHWHGTPMADWKNVSKRTSGTVIFDNYDKDHPSVLSAGEMACDDPEWDEVFNEGIIYIVKRNNILT